jgi:hypothetical protein
MQTTKRRQKKSTRSLAGSQCFCAEKHGRSTRDSNALHMTQKRSWNSISDMRGENITKYAWYAAGHAAACAKLNAP